MSPPSSIRDLRLTGLVLIAGTVIFWSGAFYVPLGRAYIARTLEEHLRVIADNRLGWLVSSGLMAGGGLLSTLALVALGAHLYQSGAGLKVTAGVALWILSSALWLAAISFRVTVTAWSAGQFGATSQVPAFFPALHRWNNLVIVLYMILAYAATALYGLGTLHTDVFSKKVAWFTLIFGLLGTLLRPVGVILFEPPLMVELVPLVLGIALVWQRR
jgi:hypothetical protein